MPLATLVDADAFPVDWRYRGLGEGVVAEDDGVAMVAKRVARRPAIGVYVVVGVERDAADEDAMEGGGGWVCRGRVTEETRMGRPRRRERVASRGSRRLPCAYITTKIICKRP